MTPRSSGPGDATLVFQQLYAAGSTTDTVYPFYTTLTGSMTVIQNGFGTTLLDPQYGPNTVTGTLAINNGVLATTGTAAALAGIKEIDLNGGVLRLGQSNGIADSAHLFQGNNVVIGANNVQETLGDWTVDAFDSILDFNGFSAALTFATLRIDGTLDIHNYAGSATTMTILSGTAIGNLSHVSFYSDAGSTFLGHGQIVGNQLVVVPEPAMPALAILGSAALMLWRCRRR